MGQLHKKILKTNIIVVVLFCLIAGRVFWLQIIQYKQFEAQATNLHTLEKIITAQRGEILAHEKDKTFAIATTKEGWLLSIDPRLVENPEQLYEALMRSGPISISKTDFIAKASKNNDPHEVIEHRLEYSVKKRIEEARLKGVQFEQEDARFYPAGNFASHILGFVGYEGTGQYGIERFYNKDLLGRDGVFIGEKSPGGRLLLLGKQIIYPEQNGTNILLTIDSGVESYLERTISNAAQKYNAQSAGGIIINPKTGSIIAMAAYPSYDPNGYSKVKNNSVFQNSLVEDLFEMGSVVKPLTMAAALDTGAIDQQTTYVDEGKRTIDGFTIKNYDGKARGRVPIQEILSQSLNMGAVFLMEQLGKDRFRQYMHRYGLSEKTNIDLPNEVSGNLKNLESRNLIEYATASFGQGISMTPIELVRALSSLANGGFLVNPYLVEELQYENGVILPKKKEEPKRILKEESSKTITRMLVNVVDTKFINGKGKIPGYSIAAKTGTAQIASQSVRGYSDEFMHTFFGYGPAYDPQFFVFFYLERPQGVRYASETLTESFGNTMRYLFSYFEVPPDRPQELANQ